MIEENYPLGTLRFARLQLRAAWAKMRGYDVWMKDGNSYCAVKGQQKDLGSFAEDLEEKGWVRV